MGASDTDLVQREEGVQLDQTVVVSENNGHGQEDEVLGVASEQAKELDPFGEAKHPHQLRDQNGNTRLLCPPFAAPPHGQRNQHVENKGQGSEGRDVEGVSAPGLLPVSEITLVSRSAQNKD